MHYHLTITRVVFNKPQPCSTHHSALCSDGITNQAFTDSVLETQGFTADRVVNKPHRRKKERKKRTSKAGTSEPRHFLLAVRCTVCTKMKPFTSHISDSKEETNHSLTHSLTFYKTFNISISVRSSRLTAAEYEWTCECAPPHGETPEFTDSERHGFWSREKKASSPPGAYCLRILEAKTVKPRGIDDINFNPFTEQFVTVVLVFGRSRFRISCCILRETRE